MKRLGVWVKFIGFVLFCFLIYKVGWKETIASIKRVSVLHVVLATLILWVAFCLKSIRWKIVSNSYGIPLKGIRALKVFFMGLFLANITPGRLGDFGRLFYIKNDLPSYEIGLSSLVMDRVFDLVCLTFFSILALIYYQLHFDILEFSFSPVIVLFGIGVLGLALVIFYLIRKKIRKVLEPWKEAFTSHNLGFFGCVFVFGLTTLSMVLIYGVFNYIAWVMDIEIDHLGLFLGTFILGILSLLPITILGIGVRESSLVIIFQLYNLPAQDAIALSLVIFLLQLISFVPGVVLFYFSPIGVGRLRGLR